MVIYITKNSYNGEQEINKLLTKVKKKILFLCWILKKTIMIKKIQGCAFEGLLNTLQCKLSDFLSQHVFLTKLEQQ